jgi:hypothetical protein
VSKGRKRKAWAAQAARKRNPKTWFAFPVEGAKKRRKSRKSTDGHGGGERGRDA